jgi:uncharacterized RDD family membrane protein YckC
VIIIILKRIGTESGKQYEADISSRFVAFVIDYAVIRLIHDNVLFLVMVSTPYYIPGALSLPYLAPYFPITLFTLPFSLTFEFFNYYLLYLLVWLMYVDFLWSMPILFSTITVIIFAFFYFFSCDAFLKGRTIGKAILKTKSVGAGGQALSFKDVVLNALGKSFLLLWDLVIGFIAKSVSSTREGSRQIRITQQLTNVSVIDLKYEEKQEDEFWLDDNAV